MGEWLSMETVPKDGTLFDVVRGGIRYTDCYWQDGSIRRRHSYPSQTRVFGGPCDGWRPRPTGLIMPYHTNEHGTRYIP